MHCVFFWVEGALTAICNDLQAAFDKTGIACGPGKQTGHCFGFVLDTESNELAQAVHIDGREAEGQVGLQ